MLRPPRPDDDRLDRRMREHPREAEGAHAHAPLLGPRAKPVESREDALVLEAPVAVRSLGHARARRVALGCPVLTGQPAARERAEGLVADAVLGTERQELRL